jgi:hypothetical protein
MNSKYNNIVEKFIVNNKIIKNKYDIRYLNGNYFKNNLYYKDNSDNIIKKINSEGLEKNFIFYDKLSLKNKRSIFLCDCCNKYFKKNMYISWYLNEIFFKTCYHCFFNINTDIELVDGTKFSNYNTIYNYIIKYNNEHNMKKCKYKNCLLCNYKKNRIINSCKNFYELNKNSFKKIIEYQIKDINKIKTLKIKI